MTASGSARAIVAPGEAASMYERVLGSVRGERPGPTLICVGGIHGNEPAGVLALKRVLEQLEGRGGELRGEFVALAGNRVALAAGSRFVDRDLNRAWTDERLERLQRDGVAGGDAEDREQVELLEAIDGIVTQARGPVYLIGRLPYDVRLRRHVRRLSSEPGPRSACPPARGARARGAGAGDFARLSRRARPRGDRSRDRPA